MLIPEFTRCEICNASDWTKIHAGPIRDGKFGNLIDNAVVARCGTCSVARLAEAYCKDEGFYESGDYRDLVNIDHEIETYYREHDHLQIFSLQSAWPLGLRGRKIVDVGCGAGSFLDHVTPLAASTIAIEPTDHFRKHLETRNYTVYPYARDAHAEHAGTADMVTSFQVIEHVAKPREFLEDMRALLRPGGSVVITTPNQNDILLDMLPDAFPAFFYRTVHRWYFDALSLAECARRAGFEQIETSFIHRYPMANALHWLRDRRPRGATEMKGVDTLANQQWKSYLEARGSSDTLVAVLTA